MEQRMVPSLTHVLSLVADRRLRGHAEFQMPYLIYVLSAEG